MKYINWFLLIFSCILIHSCAKRLTDEETFNLSNGGKSIEINITKG